VRGVDAKPLVAEIAIRADLVLVRGIRRVGGEDGPKAEGGVEELGLPDPLLGRHQANRCPVEGEDS
jgi:hypothetical protein